MFLTQEQKQYYDAMRKMQSKTPRTSVPRPKNKFQIKIYNLVNARSFELVVMFLILLNMLVMAIEHYDMDEKLQQVIDTLNRLFIVIFTLEVVLKFIGLRLYFFQAPWNIFDLVVIIVSILAATLSDWMSHVIEPSIFRVIRLFRVTRVLRLIKEAKGIRTLLFALAMSVPALANIYRVFLKKVSENVACLHILSICL